MTDASTAPADAPADDAPTAAALTPVPAADLSELGLEPEAFARDLFAQQNVTVLPSSYLSRKVDGTNPGSGWESPTRTVLGPRRRQRSAARRRRIDASHALSPRPD